MTYLTEEEVWENERKPRKMIMEHYTLEIVPAIEPRIRHRIEDILEEEGFDIIGGGTMVDGSSSDISFEK